MRTELIFAVAFFVAGTAGCSCGTESRERPPTADSGPVGFDAGGFDAGPRPDAGPMLDAGADAAADGGPVFVDAGTFDAGPPPPPCSGGATYTYVLSVLDIGQADPTGDPNIVPGFDLDMRVSDDTDALGCFHPDFTAPPPDGFMGVDNQMGPILASLGGSFDVSGTIATNIADGTLLLLARVSGVDDFVNDTCVDVEVMFGLLPAGVVAPTLDGAGLLAPGQTFDIDALSLMADGMTPLVRFPRGTIAAGRVRASSVTPFALDFPSATGTLRLLLEQPQARFDITATRVDVGVLGGALDVATTATAITALDPTIPAALVTAILEGQADLAPDATGQCRKVSIGMIFEGVPAVEGMVR